MPQGPITIGDVKDTIYGTVSATKSGHNAYMDKGSNDRRLPQTYKIETRIFTTPGGRLNKKDGLTRYGDSHVKDKTS